MRSRLLALPLFLLACGGSGGGPDASTLDAGPCDTIAVANEGWTHVTEGSTIDYQHNPPASGPHYPIWARYRVHTSALDRGYWVHNLEHGAVVLLYRPDAPTANIDALTAIYAAIPDDPACGHPRALITPDPDLDDATAVVAADIAIEGGCVDEAAILAFVADHRGHGPEDVCAQGAF